jgi:putative membrane protein
MFSRRVFSRRLSSRGILLVAASVLWAGSTAWAQETPGGGGGSGGGSQQPTPSQQQPMPGQPGSPSTGMPDAGNSPGQPSYVDQAFVHDTLEGDNAQVEMSQLAQQKSPSNDVKQFGQKMVQIHTELNNQLEPAAKQLGINDPKGPSKKAKKDIERLQALSGPDFDTAYLQAMAKQQQHDLKGFKNEAQAGQNPTLQQAAKQDQPVLTEHYQVLQKLAQIHNVTLESQK